MSRGNEAKTLFMRGEYESAFKLFSELAADGDAVSAFNVGYCCLHGYGVEKDPVMAKSYFTYAVNIVPEAAYNLAIMHLHGIGVKRNYKKSFSYMQDSASLGCVEAQLYLGIAHTLGSMFEPDVVEISLIPYHTPIYRDDSYLLMGQIDDFEEDEESRMSAVRCDPVTAFEWFREASRQDATYTAELSLKGKYLYARCYLDGVGVDFNRDKANELMVLAASEGSQEALVYLNTDAPYMLPKLEDKKYLAGIARLEGRRVELDTM